MLYDLTIGAAAGIAITVTAGWAELRRQVRHARRHTAELIHRDLVDYIDHQAPEGNVRPGHPRWALRLAVPVIERVTRWYGRTDGRMRCPGTVATTARVYSDPDATTRADRDADTYAIRIGRTRPDPGHNPEGPTRRSLLRRNDKKPPTPAGVGDRGRCVDASGGDAGQMM